MKRRAGVSMVAAGAIGVGSIGVAGVGVGLALATRSGVIHGCVAKSDGALRVVHNSHDCSSREFALSFNSRGPRGARGAPGLQGLPGNPAPASSGAFQMYANVDAEGDLGSNLDAVRAIKLQPQQGVYNVTFSKPIGTCAASAQPGEAGGSDMALQLASAATFIKDDPDTWQVSFFNAFSNSFEDTPFMLTVTCTS
jgi:hypothetical protein